MSMTETLGNTAIQVEGLRDGLGRLRSVLDQTDAVLDVADDVLSKADEMLGQAVDAVENSKRWAPRVALVLGVAAALGVAAIVVIRLRRAKSED